MCVCVCVCVCVCILWTRISAVLLMHGTGFGIDFKCVSTKGTRTAAGFLPPSSGFTHFRCAIHARNRMRN